MRERGVFAGHYGISPVAATDFLSKPWAFPGSVVRSYEEVKVFLTKTCTFTMF